MLARDQLDARCPALKVVRAQLVCRYPGISDPGVAGQVSQVLHATAIELGNGRSVPIELRRAVRGLADALRRQMQP